MKKTFGSELIESAKQGVEMLKGKRNDGRITTVIRPNPLKPISHGEITKIRTKLKVSQASFAHLLNVSPQTVQAWEQGRKIPSGPSLKLLNIAKKNPKALAL